MASRFPVSVTGSYVPCKKTTPLRGRISHPSRVDSAFFYLRKKCFYCLHILFHTQILNRLVESCSIKGIDLVDELTRGSQFHIETFLLRINKDPSFQFIFLNATESQLALQPASIAIPLVMEPFSGRYSSPVVVLDFQSLYTSIMIAYNIFLSTCLGVLNKKSGVFPSLSSQKGGTAERDGVRAGVFDRGFGSASGVRAGVSRVSDGSSICGQVDSGGNRGENGHGAAADASVDQAGSAGIRVAPLVSTLRVGAGDEPGGDQDDREHDLRLHQRGLQRANAQQRDRRRHRRICS